MELPDSTSQVCLRTEKRKNMLPLLRIQLQAGSIVLASLIQMHQAIRAANTRTVVLLESENSTLPFLQPPQEQEWIIAAGAYRFAQEEFKAQGGIIISLVTQRLVGGSYLIHGMSAQQRFLYQDATVYPGLPQETYEALFGKPYPHANTAQKALDAGIVTALTTPDTFATRLDQLLCHGP